MKLDYGIRLIKLVLSSQIPSTWVFGYLVRIWVFRTSTSTNPNNTKFEDTVEFE
jgi:hypothetical protein